MRRHDALALLGLDPSRPPQGWKTIQLSSDGGAFLRLLTDHTLILSAATEDDGRLWVHFSLAHPKRLPTWGDLVEAKEKFLGPETTALQVLAPRSKWVNIHEYCLHLWVCMDAEPVPDFSRGGKSI